MFWPKQRMKTMANNELDVTDPFEPWIPDSLEQRVEVLEGAIESIAHYMMELAKSLDEVVKGFIDE